MRQSGLILIVLLISTTALAAHRSAAEAVAIANHWLFEQNQQAGKQYAPAHTHDTHVVDSTQAWYAVATTQNIVWVAADDRMPNILGYTDQPTTIDQLPPALVQWLQTYEEELNHIRLHTPNQQSTQNTSNNTYDWQVLPLLTSTWNQSKPFNDLAPLYNETNRAAAGCVATAMAQVMYYYKYPIRGKGQYAYLWVSEQNPSLSGILSADFQNTTYQWDRMLPSYSGTYTEQQALAVATLMYHCGVSVDMGYDSGTSHSSGAVTSKVPKALYQYFDYDPNYQAIRKEIYPMDSVVKIMKQELMQQRPILISGSSDKGGHAFVCDGYNGYNYFHINWGWGGQSDGYFLLSALNPSSQGIGGTGQGYNKGTTFFIGLQPKNNASPKPIPQFACDSITFPTASITRQQSFDMHIHRLQNFGLHDFKGAYGVALYKEVEDECVAVLSQYDNYSLKAGYYRTTVAKLSQIQIPTSIPQGTYRLCAVYKNADYDWMRMMCRYDDYSRLVYVSQDSMIIYHQAPQPQLTLTQPIYFAQQDTTSPSNQVPITGLPLNFTIHNTGGTFRGDISARIYKGPFAKGQYEIMENVVIQRNQTLTSALQQQFDSTLLLNTDYTIKLCYRLSANDPWQTFQPSENAALVFQLYQPTSPEPEEPTHPTPIYTQPTEQTLIQRQRICSWGAYDLYIDTYQQGANTNTRKYLVIR